MKPRDTAGGVVVTSEGKVVVVEQGGNSWSFPKGGIEEGESALETAKREILEETGIQDLELVADLGFYMRRSLNMAGTAERGDESERKRIMFLFKTQTTNVVCDGEEITDVRALSIDDAKALLTHPKDKEFLESVRNRIPV